MARMIKRMLIIKVFHLRKMEHQYMFNHTPKGDTMDWDAMRERFNEGPEDFADWPEDDAPENACAMCGEDMDDPNIGMCETSDGDYICISCYSGLTDAAYEYFKDMEE